MIFSVVFTALNLIRWSSLTKAFLFKESLPYQNLNERIRLPHFGTSFDMKSLFIRKIFQSRQMIAHLIPIKGIRAFHQLYILTSIWMILIHVTSFSNCSVSFDISYYSYNVSSKNELLTVTARISANLRLWIWRKYWSGDIICKSLKTIFLKEQFTHYVCVYLWHRIV